MPRKAISCTVVIHIQQVTCPGTRHLADRNMLYARVSMLGDRKRTKSVFATFPLFFNERLYFERTFTNSREPSHVMEILEDESIILELVQYSEIYKSGKCLARYEQSAREFLYPSPTLTGKDGLDREVLMSRTSNFTGIDPKIEFSTVTTIEETTVPGTYSELTTIHYSSDESEDEESDSTEEEIILTPPAKLDTSKTFAATESNHCVCECPKRPENRGKVVVRSRSLSPNYKKEKTSPQNKPPFKAGKADKSLISKRDFPRQRSARIRTRTPLPALGQPVPCADCELPHSDCIVCQAYYRVFGHEFLKHRFSSDIAGHRRSATLPVVMSEPPRLRKARVPSDEEGLSDTGLNESLAYSLPIPRSSSACLFSRSMNGSYLTSTKRESPGVSARSSPVKVVSYIEDEDDSSDSDDLLSLQELRYDIDDARLDSLDRSFEDPEHPTLGTRLDRSLRGF